MRRKGQNIPDNSIMACDDDILRRQIWDGSLHYLLLLFYYFRRYTYYTGIGFIE